MPASASRLFNLQGHRGARGLKPENTLPAFEIALDLGVSSIETDVHVTRDHVPVLIHDPVVSEQLCRALAGSAVPDPTSRPLISSLSLIQLRGYRADRNPDSRRFPQQDNSVTPLARLFAQQLGLDPYGPPALLDLFAFAEEYAGDLGTQAGKTAAQQAAARRVRFDLELKRVPFRTEVIGDSFDGSSPGLLEHGLLACIRAAGAVGRTGVRSFDHRSVRVLRQLEPGLTGAILIAETAPVSPGQLARQADAQAYCPDFRFLDESLVREAHTHGVRVLPWTVNEPADWYRLLDWGVDGITTDFPDRLAEWLRRRGIAF